MKQLLLMTLIICSLSACTSLELVHDPVGCLNNPDVTIGLTEDEFKAIGGSEDKATKKLQDSALRKIILFGKTLRARIDTQCKINEEHDRLHSAEE